MSTPTKVLLGGKWWTIKDVAGLHDKKGEYGSCNYYELLIKLDKKQTPAHKRDSLWHELTHSIETELDLKITEKQVRQLATMQVALLRQNPSLVSFLLEPDDETEDPRL